MCSIKPCFEKDSSNQEMQVNSGLVRHVSIYLYLYFSCCCSLTVLAVIVGTVLATIQMHTWSMKFSKCTFVE